MLAEVKRKSNLIAVFVWEAESSPNLMTLNGNKTYPNRSPMRISTQLRNVKYHGHSRIHCSSKPKHFQIC
jgi:hypothetical protein